jgi:hypothetical protein
LSIIPTVFILVTMASVLEANVIGGSPTVLGQGAARFGESATA